MTNHSDMSAIIQPRMDTDGHEGQTVATGKRFMRLVTKKSFLKTVFISVHPWLKTFLLMPSAVFFAANFLGYAVGNANAGATNESTSANEKTSNHESSQKRTVSPKPDSEEAFVSMFNGKDLTGWTGSDFTVEDGILVCHGHHGSGLSYTKSEFTNFVLRFEVKLSPGANNGLNFRTDGAIWNEIQILDDTHPTFTNIHPYQAHGSIYGVAPAKRGFLKPVGQWNYQEVTAEGSHLRVRLNGEVIVDVELSKLDLDKCLDGTAHPGLRRTHGGIGWLGHLNGYEKEGAVHFRNIRIKTLP